MKEFEAPAGHLNLAVVTPVKNEIDNLPKLFSCMEAQVLPPTLWIIVDDGSTDGSSAFLAERAKSVRCVERVIVVRPSHLPPEYALGFKYSSVIKAGLDELARLRRDKEAAWDFFGILDADCFLMPDYYERLLLKFQWLPKLGIGSGVIHYRNRGGLRYDGLPLRWPRGAIRVWRAACLEQTGYQPIKSADAISAARAWVAGWECQAFKDCVAESREMGAKTNHRYYGTSYYARYVPLYQILPKAAWMCFRDGRNAALETLRGYFQAMQEGNRLELERELVTYFRLLPLRNLIESYVAMRNRRLLQRMTAAGRT